MHFRRFRKLLAFAAISGCVPLFAGLILERPPELQTGTPGQTLVYTGNLINDGLEPLFLYGLSASFDNPAQENLALATDIFFTEAPLSLAGGAASGEIPLFTVSILPDFNGDFSTYRGLFAILGGLDADAQEILENGEFSVHVTPEPSFAPGFILAALLTCWQTRRKMREHVPLGLPRSSTRVP